MSENTRKPQKPLNFLPKYPFKEGENILELVSDKYFLTLDTSAFRVKSHGKEYRMEVYETGPLMQTLNELISDGAWCGKKIRIVSSRLDPKLSCIQLVEPQPDIVQETWE